ncbi:hypothetical protein SAMN05216241_1244 [Limimonas halophila]|uniref:Uncharacterized protein n=1 Tax=Limimonas halophila TaxID=1082479 RepID=A0A1G7V8U9_9PROT|nr:hypothetical protein [Limimonas halophila]SDG56193.1 hypothetical protein SAMN05216241_1244 [Limimonas halophila]
MDAESIKEAYQEAVDEATGGGVDAGTAHQEGVTAAAMMVSAMDGLEDADARSQVEAVVG